MTIGGGARRGAALALGAALTLGCPRIDVEVLPPAARRAPGQLLAGAARVDITPPPGLPMGGHAIGGTESRGAWGRLYARALVIEDPRGQPLALVVGDLWAVSAGLTDAVIERLQRDHGLANFDRGSVILAATHTHHSPASIADNIAHNFAAGVTPAFDRRLFDAVAGAIAGAIAEAYERREPARVAGLAAALPGYARNRSLAAFRRDPEAAGWITATPGPGFCVAPSGVEEDACRAIEPRVFALRLHARADQRLLGAALFVAAHPTAMPNRTPVYHGDIFELAAARLEDELARGGEGPVIALFNGAEGDVSPAWRAQGMGESVRVAEVLGDGVRYLLGAPATTIEIPSIRERHGVFGLAARELEGPDGERRRTARGAVLGMVALGGAEDGPTEARVPPEGRARRRAHRDGHGRKLKLLPIAAAFLPPEAPLSVIRLGGHVLATLPGEVTTVMGARIRAGIADAADVDADRVHLVGLAQTYRSYFTTPEEYDAQHYEGASTIYGRASGPRLAADLACLAAPVGRCEGRAAPERVRYRPGAERRLALPDAPRPPRWFARGLEELDRLFRVRGVAPTYLYFETPVPAAAALGDAAWPRVTAEIESAGAWFPWSGPKGAERDDLHRFVTAVVSDEGERWRWRTRWIDPRALPEGARARIRVSFAGREIGCSPPLERAALLGGGGALMLAAEPCADGK